MWKVYVFGIFLVRILRIRTEYGPEKFQIGTLFMQCITGTYTEVSSTQTFSTTYLKLQN